MSASPKNICIIGGSGFFSGAVRRLAAEAGYNVYIVTRGQRPIPQGVTAITADRKDRDAFARGLATTDVHFDLVVDCMGFVEEDAKQDVDVFRDRADHLVFISTDFVFDPVKRVFPTPAEHDQFETNLPYGKNKRRCELYFHNNDTGDMRWTIFRPCHIYGPGLPLGCLPVPTRDPQLLDKMKRGEPLKLVGGGYFLQQPIYYEDLARAVLSCPGNDKVHGRIFMSAGPDIILSRTYYDIIADILGVDVSYEEVAVDQYIADHPEHLPFLTHRIYDLSPMRDAGITVPDTPIAEGLRHHTQWVLDGAQAR
jgi:nucleoside-diphosphate-sugar epimerase